jgi:putative membrane protein
MTIVRSGDRSCQDPAVTPRIRLWAAAAVLAVFGGLDAAAQTAIAPSAPDFAMSAAQSDEYEIQAGQDAVAQSQNPQIRGFAQQMIDGHTRTRESLRQAAVASGLPPPPPSMSSDQAMLLSSLQSLRGPEFDQAYARQQVLAHRQALAVAQSYAATGGDGNLRKAAQAALPLVQHHLDMAQQISTAVGGS